MYLIALIVILSMALCMAPLIGVSLGLVLRGRCRRMHELSNLFHRETFLRCMFHVFDI